MKRVTFVGTADIELTLEVDFSDAQPDEQGQVRVQAKGIDVEGEDPRAALIYGWYSPNETREIARYFSEMADKAEAGEGQ